MNLKKIRYSIKPPCPKCPYMLGLVHTLVNPCPQCKANGYRSFELFKAMQLPGMEGAKGDPDGSR